MQKLRLIFSDAFKNYELIERIEQSIGFLSIYLHDMLCSDIPAYIQWALDPNDLAIETNCSWLEKKDSYILIGSRYNEPEAKLQYFKILSTEFVKLLTEWEKLVKAKTKRIIIIQNDDGAMSISGE